MHFEDIWNDAEELAKKENREIKELFSKLHTRIDILQAGLSLGGKSNTVNIGEILFSLCDIAQRISSKEDPCNVAAGLRLAIETHKATLYDPEDEDT